MIYAQRLILLCVTFGCGVVGANSRSAFGPLADLRSAFGLGLQLEGA